MLAPIRQRVARLYRAARVRLPGGLSLKTRGNGNRVVYDSSCDLRRVSVRFSGNHNVVTFLAGSHSANCRIDIDGDSNCVTMRGSRLRQSSLVVRGNSNSISTEAGCTLAQVTITCEDDNNVVEVRERTEFAGVASLAAIEGTRIEIGRNCLFSSDIHVRTGDSHSVTDMQGRRVNPSRDVVIGNHVWIGARTIVLKGAGLPDSCVVGAGSVVTKCFETPHCAIAGNPAGIVRRNIDWLTERVRDSAH